LLPVAVITCLAAAPLPPECEQPELRDVLPLKQLAQLDGALSVGLDSVATWCFDPGGSWTGGQPPKPGKGKQKVSKDTPATGDCAKAIASCEAAAKAADKRSLRDLATYALGDLERSYRGAKYFPKRTGLKDKPKDKADCNSQERSELFAQAQARMDIARLTSQIQSEYANYKAWLMQESMKCRSEVLAQKRGAKDPTRVAVDSSKPEPKPEPVKPEPREPKPEPAPKISVSTSSATSTETAAVTVAKEPPGNWVTERETALAKPLLEKWKYLAEQTAKQEADRDYTLGFLASRELRACDCTRVNPGAIVRALEKKEGGNAGMALLQSEDGANTKCAVCALDAYNAWKPRLDKQCRQMDALTEFELEKFAQSDDANGIPPRCTEAAKARHAAEKKKKADDEAAAAKAKVAATPAPVPAAPADAGTVVASAAKPEPTPAPAPAPAPAPVAQTNPNLVTVNGMTYYRPPGSDAGLPAAIAPSAPVAAAPVPDSGRTLSVAAPAAGSLSGPGVPATVGPVTASAESFVPPEAWAPIPPREEGRMYVRLSMSAACIAEISPGPIQARTGDLLLVPFGAPQLSVKSPCGGLAEIYWGKEAKPRFSEVFPRNQAIKFEFKNP